MPNFPPPPPPPAFRGPPGAKPSLSSQNNGFAHPPPPAAPNASANAPGKPAAPPPGRFQPPPPRPGSLQTPVLPPAPMHQQPRQQPQQTGYRQQYQPRSQFAAPPPHQFSNPLPPPPPAMQNQHQQASNPSHGYPQQQNSVQAPPGPPSVPYQPLGAPTGSLVPPQPPGPPRISHQLQQPPVHHQQQPGPPSMHPHQHQHPPPGPPGMIQHRQQQPAMPPQPSVGPPGMNSIPQQQQPQPPIAHQPPGRYPSQQPNAGYSPQQKGAYPPQSQQQSPDPFDPARVPRPPLFTEPQKGPLPVYYPKAALLNGDGSAPPPPNTRYLVYDDGNASPNVLRSTVYAFPANRAIWKKTGDLPLGICSMPLAGGPPQNDPTPQKRVLPDGSIEEYQSMEAPPLVVESTPTRCKSCAAYANHFVENGVCNFCGRSDANLMQASGSCLQSGTVEYQVDGPYITRPTPVQPVHLYVIDLTSPHVLRYLPLLEQLGQEQQNTRIGLCFVSSAGVVLCSRSEMQQASELDNNPEHETNSGDSRYMYMSDVTHDPFCPLPLAEWTFDLSTVDERQSWSCYISGQLVRDMEHLKKQATSKNAYGLDGFEQSCGGAALAVLADALEVTGGRGTLITWRRPNFGVGKLSYRQVDQAVLQGRSRKEDARLYTPAQLHGTYADAEEADAARFYKELGEKCTKARVALDIIMHTGPPSPQQFYGLGTLGELCHVTTGKLTWITAPKWEESFFQDQKRQLQIYSGWDAVFKLRCSSGVQVKSILSNCGAVVDSGLGESPELELSCVTPNSTISVEVEHRVGGLPKESRFAFFQTALLYTSRCGKRRVRVSTLAIRVTNVVSDVFRSADQASTIIQMSLGATNYLRKTQGGEENALPPRQTARDALLFKCTDILVNYRRNTPAITSPSGQLMLPESLQLLPLFCMCLHKRPTFCPALPRRVSGNAVAMTPSGDERAYYNYHLSQTSPTMAMLLSYPGVFSVKRCENGNIGVWNRGSGEGIGAVEIPGALSPSMESLQDDGIYLVDDGLRFYLYIGKLVADDAKREACCEDASQFKEVLHMLLWQLRTFSSTEQSDIRPVYPPAITVVQRDGHQGPGETEILSLMVEDANAGEKDYIEFLRNMHRRVRDRVQAST